ncbi:UNVERIFIED_CONTAM: hypothetical protein FKN15_051882 [Acipenser sinensis]
MKITMASQTKTLLCLGVVLSCVADAAHLHSDHTLTADGYSFSLSQVREWINGINSRTPIDESRSLAAWTYRDDTNARRIPALIRHAQCPRHCTVDGKERPAIPAAEVKVNMPVMSMVGSTQYLLEYKEVTVACVYRGYVDDPRTQVSNAADGKSRPGIEGSGTRGNPRNLFSCTGVWKSISII